MKNILVVYENGTIEEKKIAGDELKFLQRIVDGYIETITTRQYIFIVNEDGIMKGLAPNKIATVLCKADGGEIGSNPIFGNVAIMTGGKNGEMNGLTEGQLNTLATIVRMAKEK